MNQLRIVDGLQSRSHIPHNFEHRFVLEGGLLFLVIKEAAPFAPLQHNEEALLLLVVHHIIDFGEVFVLDVFEFEEFFVPGY